MSGDFDEFNGEFNHSLKGFKIPFKVNAKVNDCDTPVPPGTEDMAIQQSNANMSISPLTTVYQAPQPKFAIHPQSLLPPPPPPPPADDKPNDKHKPSASSSSSLLFTKPSDDGLPVELTKLFRPFCCDLCSTKLNSPASARLHYESKNHDKKINAWILKTGEPIPKRKIIDKGPTGPNALHCDACDLPLTSIQHAKQHYMGRKHKNVVAGRGKPGGSGYYDSNNKWVRTSQIPDEDPNNRFAIGESFLKPCQSQQQSIDADEKEQSQSEPIDGVPESFLNAVPSPLNEEWPAAPTANDLYLASSDSLVIPIISKESLADLSTHCEICDINVTSELHMRLHLNGAKHAKRLRQLGEPPYTDSPDMLAQCIISAAKTTSPTKIAPAASAAAAAAAAITTTTVKRKHPSTVVSESTANSDFSVFRTPSGQYYCQICDLSVTSEVTLSQHFSSKRHIRAVSVSKRK